MPKTILIVDDEPDVIKIIIFRMEKSGYKILSALNGREALDLLEVEKPDLIILDLIMPVMDGYEFCRRIKEGNNESLKNIPILILTASATGNMIDKTKELTADDYMVKPFEAADLLKKIKLLLKE